MIKFTRDILLATPQLKDNQKAGVDVLYSNAERRVTKIRDTTVVMLLYKSTKLL